MSKNSRRRAQIEAIARQNALKETSFIETSVFHFLRYDKFISIAFKVGVAAFSLFLLYQCTYENSRDDVAECLAKVKRISEKYEAFKDYEYSSTHPVESLKAEIYNELKKDINAMSQYVHKNVKTTGSNIKYLKNCNLDYYEQTKAQEVKLLDAHYKEFPYVSPPSEPEEKKLSPQELRAKVEQEMAEAYRQIDEAEVKDFAAARKRAVRHYKTIPGPGIQVETFVFKDGRTVMCSTKIGSTGRLTSCDGSID